MIKIYTTDSNTSKTVSSPKKEVLDNILNYSKALEVIKKEDKKSIEIILN